MALTSVGESALIDSNNHGEVEKGVATWH